MCLVDLPPLPAHAGKSCDDSPRTPTPTSEEHACTNITAAQCVWVVSSLSLFLCCLNLTVLLNMSPVMIVITQNPRSRPGSRNSDRARPRPFEARSAKTNVWPCWKGNDTPIMRPCYYSKASSTFWLFDLWSLRPQPIRQPLLLVIKSRLLAWGVSDKSSKSLLWANGRSGWILRISLPKSQKHMVHVCRLHLAPYFKF